MFRWILWRNHDIRWVAKGLYFTSWIYIFVFNLHVFKNLHNMKIIIWAVVWRRIFCCCSAYFSSSHQTTSLFPWQRHFTLPIEAKPSTRCSCLAWQKTCKKNPKNGALRWFGKTDAECLVHKHERTGQRQTGTVRQSAHFLLRYFCV